MVDNKDKAPLRCTKYTDFQPGITRATLYYLRWLPDASGETGRKDWMICNLLDIIGSNNFIKLKSLNWSEG